MATRALRAKATLATGPEAHPVPRILIVDDDDRNLLATETILEDIAQVVTARSGEEALRHLLKDEFAVILLDVYMPGIDGYETAQLIRQREQTRRIPIIFLSAVNKETEHLVRGYAMGAVDYVFKPVEPVFLRAKVAVFVDLFNMAREIERKAEQEQRLMDANLRANTERLRIEQQLRIAEQQQAAIIASLPIMLYVGGLDARSPSPRFVGGNVQAVTGYAPGDLMASPNLWIEQVHAEDRERLGEVIAARAEGRSMSVEYRWRCADGGYKHFLDQAVLLNDEVGRPTELAGSVLDVTDRRQLELQLTHVRKMDAIGKLTGGIAHDFNNLLASVLGGLELIQRRVALNEEQSKLIAMTRRAAEQGSELVGRLLAFARRQQLNPTSVEPASLFGSVTALLEHTLGGLVELQTQAGSDAWSVFADETQLELALVNLIINARDAMPGGGRIVLAAENRIAAEGNGAGVAPGEYGVLSVTDDGDGIPAQLLEQVLEPFFTTKEVGKGTGLGLSMVYGFAQQSGGGMRIESKFGEGARVEIWLPRDGEARAPMVTRPKMAKLSEPGRPLKVMLVDDHEVVRATTAGILADLGHDVTAPPGPREALALLQPGPDHYDLLITDYAMPLLSGIELIRQCRDMRPDLPAIIITGFADAQALSHRPDNVQILAKPFLPEDLNQVVRATSSVSVDALAG